VSFTLILAITAAAAASAGYLAARRKSEPASPDDPDDPDAKRDKRGPGPGDPSEARKAQPKPAPEAKGGGGRKPAGGKPKPAEDIFAELPLALGDVVSALEEERWLSGALVAREDGKVQSVLFVAPEGATLAAVAAFAPPNKTIWWMSPATLSSPDEPPATIELDGVAFRRKGRLPVAMERLGQGAPSVGPEAIWGAYEGGKGEVAVVITSQGNTYAWMGRRLDEDQYDRLGAG
jgi:hypothetical protein